MKHTDVMGVICNIQMLWELYETYRCYGSYMKHTDVMGVLCWSSVYYYLHIFVTDCSNAVICLLQMV